ncbi:MAG: hypothetical protein HZA66_05425 [Rhodopseudomonas palustris]|uniref:Uncharacterized protein n=1 Tax=Rhodopseudomonas palustris TaxID=1076 RepID=A0A933RV73_RHOPL|nr:hypothetical protein [Rhodopseudomonas palustris]
MVLGILLNFAGLGVICWAMFRLAVFALPFFVGVIAGFYALQIGAGPLGAIAAGIMLSAFALVLGQYAFATARSATVRVLVGTLFVLPAVVAGYQLALGLADFGMVPTEWQRAFAVLGAVVIGGTALARIRPFSVPLPSESVHAA